MTNADLSSDLLRILNKAILDLKAEVKELSSELMMHHSSATDSRFKCALAKLSVYEEIETFVQERATHSRAENVLQDAYIAARTKQGIAQYIKQQESK